MFHGRASAHQERCEPKGPGEGQDETVTKKMQVSGTWRVPNEQKTFDFFFEACEAEKGGLTGRRISRKVVLVP